MKDQQCVRSNLAATPTNACRIPIFSPTRRPQVKTSWRVETSWGWAVITGRLGQQHRDLLDAARMVADEEQWTADGRYHLKVDPARLRSAMGGDSVNNARIVEWLRDMRAAEVTVHITATNKTTYGGIVADFTDSADPTLLHGRAGTFPSERRYLRLSFGLGWSKLIEEDRTTLYPLRQVVALKHGFSQAVARFCLSHATVRDTVGGLMLKLNASGRLRVRRAELTEDAAGLMGMGIIIDGDKINTARQQSPVGRQQSPVPASKVRWKRPLIS